MNNNVMTNCHNCGSNNISLDMTIGKLRCNSCGHIYESTIEEKPNAVNEFESIHSLEGNIISDGSKNINEGTLALVTYKCNKCGFEYVTSEKNNNPICIFCNKQLDNTEMIQKENNTKYILPFKINKEMAINTIQSELNNKSDYLIDSFMNKLNLDKLICLYIPHTYWDAKYKCHFSGQGEKKIKSHYSDDNVSYTADVYDVDRNCNVEVKLVSIEEKYEIIDTKDKAFSNIISALNPFDSKEILPVDGIYLQDCVAMLIDNKEMTFDESFNSRLINITKYALLDSISFYDRGVRWDKNEISEVNHNLYNVYLPVYLYMYTEIVDNKEEYYYIALNGRTGETAFHIPFDSNKAKGKSKKKAFIICTVICLLLNSFFIPFAIMSHDEWGIFAKIMIVVIIGLIYFVLLPLLYKHEYKSIENKYKGDHVVGENDSKIDFAVSNMLQTDNKVKTIKSNDIYISGINDNSKEIRFKRYISEHNVTVIKK